jgi:hypothetical protein
MIGLAWAFAIGLGRDFLHWRAKRKANVLYIDGEMPRQLIQERIALACKWFAVEPSDARRVKILSSEDFEDMPPLDTEAGQQWLNGVIEGHGPFDFIIFDNIMSLCSGIMKEEESWRAMKPFVLSLTKRRIGQLWLHHTGHDKTKAYGTKTREWQMDTAMVGEKAGSEHISFVLKFTKHRRRNPSNRDDYSELHIELGDDGIWRSSRPQKELNESEKKALQALRNAIAEAGCAVSKDDWRKHAYELGISKSEENRAQQIAFQRASEALVKCGLVVVEADKYSLAQ